MKKKLMLIEKRSYKSKTGDQKYKYLFLDQSDVAFVGYSDYDVLHDRLADEESYNPARAHEYEVLRDVFNDQLVSRVQIEA